MTEKEKEIAAAIAGLVATFDESPHDSTFERGFRTGVIRAAEVIAYRLKCLDKIFNREAFFAACNIQEGTRE